MSQEDVGTKAPEQAFHDIVNLNYRSKTGGQPMKSFMAKKATNKKKK